MSPKKYKINITKMLDFPGRLIYTYSCNQSDTTAEEENL